METFLRTTIVSTVVPWAVKTLNVKITPLPATRTVTIEVTGDGLTQQEAEHLVESADFSPYFSGEWKVVKK